ncbi:MAG TPA: glycosyltransferase family 4 protein [Usitatibacter sp.]|nr:glycosyltransferase family 4 protein [Usitatibacter sp.]
MMREPGLPRPKVALVSIGIGRVQRGFERYFGELFELLREEVPVTLFRSAGGQGGSEVVPPLLGPATAIARRAPLDWLAGRAEYNRDCLAFAATMLPRLIRERFDVIHCIDPPLAYALVHAKRVARLRSRLLFTEGSVMPPRYYPRVDHIHHVAQSAHAAALAHGVTPARMTLVPCGLRVDRFPLEDDKRELRARFGIAASTFLVLAVSAVKREHKRIDHIVGEVARLPGDVLLWIDGNPEDAQLVAQARERLGSRLRVTHVPSSEVAELYRAADVFVHAALEESFGLAILEAACCGTPVLVHDTPHFAWLLGDRSGLVDMRADGALAARLGEVARNRDAERANARARAQAIRRRFDWRELAPQYLRLYASACGMEWHAQGAVETAQ